MKQPFLFQTLQFVDARLTFTDSILVAGGRMFKRLSKSRRHSADDVALSLSSPTTLDEPPGTSTPRDNCQSISPAALLRVSRTKYTRRSCGDASAMQALLATKQEQEQDAAEADYQMVTAVPAFIVEHEPEKQRGKCTWIRCCIPIYGKWKFKMWLRRGKIICLR